MSNGQIAVDVLCVAKAVGDDSDSGRYVIESYVAPDEKALGKLIKKLKRGRLKNFMEGDRTVPVVVEYMNHGSCGDFDQFSGKCVGDFIVKYLQLTL